MHPFSTHWKRQKTSVLWCFQRVEKGALGTNGLNTFDMWIIHLSQMSYYKRLIKCYQYYGLWRMHIHTSSQQIFWIGLQPVHMNNFVWLINIKSFRLLLVDSLTDTAISYTKFTLNILNMTTPILSCLSSIGKCEP